MIGAIFAPPKEQKCDNLGAYAFLQVRGKQYFKSPSTVDFASYPSAAIVSNDCKTYSIKTYADAQNSYGGIVRSTVVAKVEYINQTGTILDLQIND